MVSARRPAALFPRTELPVMSRKPGFMISGEDGFDDVAVDVGEAEVPALGAEGETLVVKAKAVHQGGLEVVDVDGARRLLGSPETACRGTKC